MANLKYGERNVSLPVENFSVTHGLLSNPLVSSSGNENVSHGIKVTGKKETVMYRRIHSKSVVESAQWVGWQRVNQNLYQYVPRSNDLNTWETDEYESLQEKISHSLKHQINWNCKKGPKDNESGLLRYPNNSGFPQVPFDPHRVKSTNSGQQNFYNQHVVVHSSYCIHPSPDSTGNLQQNVPQLVKLRVPSQGVLNGFQPYKWVKIPNREDASGTPTDSQPRSKYKLYNEDNFKQDFKSRASKERWIPVARKESKISRTDTADICSELSDSSFFNNSNDDHHLLGNIISLSGPETLSVPKSTSLVSSPEVTSVENEAPKFESFNTKIEGEVVDCARDYLECAKQPKDTLQFLIGSPMAAVALNAAYKLRLASEKIQLDTGCPLAQFERLLHSAAPVISSSHVYKKCTVCLNNQMFHSPLCKHQIPNISLVTVWNWYEKPGNYGLEVKAEDSQNLIGLHTDSISCHAHFVPSLSAVQLFGYPHFSNCGRTSEHIVPEMLKKGEVQSCTSSGMFLTNSSEAVAGKHNLTEKINFTMDLGRVEEPISSLRAPTCNECQSGNLSSLCACSSNAELIFEFFESVQPQLRKPLHNKITELVGSGTSNNKVFGDPLKLESSNLCELHPASWFSVAWYPIYRIPEGKFRASFLTYHSLGFLTKRCLPNDSVNKNLFSVVSPVLGLQSYNTQSECWFDPKIPINSSFKQWTRVNTTEIIKERLRTLEENALLFARGCVFKNDVKIYNRHADYEFFISRKC